MSASDKADFVMDPYRFQNNSITTRVLTYTIGYFTDPKTRDAAYQIYKHRDKCVTIHFKNSIKLGTFNPDKPKVDCGGFESFPIKQFSFEVDDKNSSVKIILDCLKKYGKGVK